MKPIILLTCYHVYDEELSGCRPRGVKGQDMEMCSFDYIEAITLSGGVPVVLPNIKDKKGLEQLLEIADGVLFTGGEDLHPEYYGERVEQSNLKIIPQRDTVEMLLAEKALCSKHPVLGVCRGMQLLNVAAGGTLYQDIYKQTSAALLHGGHGKEKTELIHQIQIADNSRIRKIYQCSRKGVNSYHHQSIKKLAEELRIAAVSEDNLIEAFEHKQDRFLIGVQWHPEMMFKKHHEELELFKSFIEEAWKFKRSK